MMGKKEPLAVRFASKVDRNGSVPEHSPHLGRCWVWTGKISRSGYGRIWDGSGVRYAHRVSYELHRVRVPDGMQVNHSCDNRKCVNPAHLHLGDHISNAREMYSRGRCKIPGLKGSRHGLAKLDEAKVIAARVAHASGETIKSLACQYGVSPRAMSFALSGEHWGHI